MMRRLPVARGVVTELERMRAERDLLLQERHELTSTLHSLGSALDRTRAEPSFQGLYESMKRQHAWATKDHDVQHPIWRVNAKTAGRSLAVSLGVRVPQLLAGPTSADRLEEPEAERFVVKPVEGFSGNGVHALVRDGGRLWSVFDQRSMSWEEVRGAVARKAEEELVSREVFVEELLHSGHPHRTLPFDWKCYCIGGRVELVMQRDTRDRRGERNLRFKFWSPELTELGPVRHPNRYDASMPAPWHPEDLVEAAERVARALPGPFVRVDLYDGPGGVCFGEITPHPGGLQRFTPDLDRRLGEAWERALAAELARAPDRTPAPPGRRSEAGGPAEPDRADGR